MVGQVHLIVLLLAGAVAAQTWSHTCELLHLIVYISNGKGLRWKHTFFALDFVAQVCPLSERRCASCESDGFGKASKAEPRKQQDWILKYVQGGRARPLTACGSRRSAALHCPRCWKEIRVWRTEMALETTESAQAVAFHVSPSVRATIMDKGSGGRRETAA